MLKGVVSKAIKPQVTENFTLLLVKEVVSLGAGRNEERGGGEKETLNRCKLLHCSI